VIEGDATRIVSVIQKKFYILLRAYFGPHCMHICCVTVRFICFIWCIWHLFSVETLWWM